MLNKTAIAVITMGFLAGCGVNIKETHLFQARDRDGMINYYKIDLLARATNGKVDFKSGLYDAEALNALLGEVNDSDSMDFDKELQKLRREALKARAKSYFDAAANAAEMKKERDALGRVLEPFDTRPKKFAIINSSVASVVEEGIANFMEVSKSEDLLYAAFAASKREGYIEAKVEQKQLGSTRLQVFAIYSAATFLQKAGNCKSPPVAANDNKCRPQLEKLLEDLASLPTQ